MTLLAFDDVSCARGGRELFGPVSFVANPGDAVLISGPNGVGKSSLVRIAAGLLDPSDGTVTATAERALLTEAPALDMDLTLSRALEFWARIDDRVAQIPAALVAFDLSALAAVPVRLLSTGQRKRAGLARVAASGARLWLLDEPANGLDDAALVLLERAIAAHRADGGAVLVATHQPIALNAAQHIELRGPA